MTCRVHILRLQSGNLIVSIYGRDGCFRTPPFMCYCDYFERRV